MFEILTGQTNSDFKNRNLDHVKKFYSTFAKEAVKICLDYNIPPAAVLAIAGLESGFGSGYVARITGNILSLGAKKGEIALPPITVPMRISDGTVFLDSSFIQKVPREDIVYKRGAPSLKKDYRPDYLAGKGDSLDYFKRHRDKYKQAKLKNIEDFCKFWIVDSSSSEVFKKARFWADSIVVKKGKEFLLTREASMEFIDLIGGRPHSFNYRETWPKKVKSIIKSVGLAHLSKEIYLSGSTFESAWRKR